MGNIKSKLGSLEKFSKSKQKQEHHLKKLAEAREKAKPEKMAADAARRIRHAAHLRACAAKALKMADRLEAKTEVDAHAQG